MLSQNNKEDIRLGLATIAAGTAAFAGAMKDALSQDELTADGAMYAMRAVTTIQNSIGVLIDGLRVDYETGVDGGQHASSHVSDSELPDINFVSTDIPNN